MAGYRQMSRLVHGNSLSGEIRTQQILDFFFHRIGNALRTHGTHHSTSTRNVCESRRDFVRRWITRSYVHVPEVLFQPENRSIIDGVNPEGYYDSSSAILCTYALNINTWMENAFSVAIYVPTWNWREGGEYGNSYAKFPKTSHVNFLSSIFFRINNRRNVVHSKAINDTPGRLSEREDLISRFEEWSSENKIENRQRRECESTILDRIRIRRTAMKNEHGTTVYIQWCLCRRAGCSRCDLLKTFAFVNTRFGECESTRTKVLAHFEIFYYPTDVLVGS